MADYYATEFVGAADGTSNPPKKLDGRLVGAKKRRNRATKPAVTLNIGDRFYIGKVPQGGSPRAFSVNTDTSLGSATLSIGTAANPTKYVNARTVTVTDTPTGIGPRASVHVAAPLTADEHLWVTIGGASIAAGVIAAVETEYTIST
jgi:hypothetical protein